MKKAEMMTDNEQQRDDNEQNDDEQNDNARSSNKDVSLYDLYNPVKQI